MAILFDKENQLFLLQAGKGLSYAFRRCSDGVLEHLYCGPRVDMAGLTGLVAPTLRSFAPYQEDSGAEASPEVRPQEFSGFDTGDFRIPSAIAVTASGHRTAAVRWKDHRIFAGKPPLPGLPATRAGEDEADSLEVTLTDAAAGLEYTLCYSVFRNLDVITRSVRVSNRGNAPVMLEKLSSLTMDFQGCGTAPELLSLSGCYGLERGVERESLRHGITELGSTRGHSGHNLNPAFGLAEPHADETHGRVYGFLLLYSGNFSAQIEYNQFADVRIQLGINPANFRWHLEPGETFFTPEAALTVSDRGLGRMSRTFHDLIRGHLLRAPWNHRRHPLLLNSWETVYFDFNRARLLSLARTAASCGLELLVLDDGWFGRREDDTTSLGDWWANEDKLGGPLADLTGKINQLGLKFGLWFEPEMVSPESELFAAHSDWCLAVPGRQASLSRSQLVLDMSRPEVVDYLFAMMSRILDTAPITYIKWDANRSITEGGSGALPPERQMEVAHRYILGVYELHERLLTRYPELLIEGCCGGGGRFDAGMLAYVAQIWCSDNTDAAARLAIQYGTSLFYPPSVIGAHVSASPNQQTGRNMPLAARVVTAFAGTFGWELDLSRLPEAELSQVQKENERFRQWHYLVDNGDLYRLSSPGDYAVAWLNLAKDGSEFLLSAVVPRIGAVYSDPVCLIRLDGLEPKAHYREDESGSVFAGSVLMNAGFRLQLATCDGSAWRWHFRKLSGAENMKEKELASDGER